MKQVKDENNGRKCLYFVDEDVNAELTRRLLDGISHSLKDDPTIVDWVVGEMKKNHCENFVGDWDDEPTTSMMSKDSEDGRYTMYWNSYGEIEIWGNENISDSRRIKDENTPNVLDGVLFIAFEDGTEDEMIAEVNKHKNESGNIDGVQYETYEIDSDDGVAMIDMCAATDNANGFIKALLKKWGIAKNVIDLEFDASDEMKEAVNDSRNPDADKLHYNVQVENSGILKTYKTVYNRNEAIELAKKLEGQGHYVDVEQYDPKYNGYGKTPFVNIWRTNDSAQINDMTKPARLRGYAEKVRVNRRKKNEETENEPENEKQDVADSRRVKDDKPKYDEYFVKKVECYINDGDDIVFVAALSKNGGDGAAIRRVREKFPDLDIIEVYNTDGCIDVYNMTDAQYKFCEEGAIMIPEDMEFRSVDDLEWI